MEVWLAALRVFSTVLSPPSLSQQLHHLPTLPCILLVPPLVCYTLSHNCVTSLKGKGEAEPQRIEHLIVIYNTLTHN